MLGSLLDGRYRIIQLLGKGGMGNVYLAEETRLKRRCALKVLHPHLAADRAHVERFLREAQMIAQLEHPNIVDIYAYGEEASGVAWFAMEMLAGEDLDARGKARAQRPFSTHEACAWGIQIARAVEVVHQAGLIHRDLKTSNIFLAQRRDGEEIVKLLDFGIARPEEGSELTATGIALGTPSYMSPEQARSTGVDRRSDVYSFGVLLFKLLTNRVPFTGDAIQVAVAHCTLPMPVPSSVATEADISPELDAVVLRATAKEPLDRYQSMREVEEALGAILHAEAPELAPAVKVTRLATNSQIRPPPVAHKERLAGPAPITLPATATATADAGTAPTAMHPTGPTSALPVHAPAGSQTWLYVTTGASIVGVVLLLVVAMFASEDEPTSIPNAAPEGKPTPASQSPRSMPVEPPTPTKTTLSAPASTPILPTPAQPPSAEPKPAEPKPVVTVEPTPAPPPITPAPTVKTPTPEKAKTKPAAAPIDPLQQIARKAQSCRRQHKAVDGPKINIDYAIGMDGKVTRSIPSPDDELGKCIAAVVKATNFGPLPSPVLGRKISL